MGRPGEQLDRARSHVAVVVAPERRVVGAVELVDVEAAGVRVGEDAVDVPTAARTSVGEILHLRRLQDAVEVRPNRDAVMTVERRELALGRTARWCGQPPRITGHEGMQDETGKHEVVGPVAMRHELLVRRVHVVDLGQHDEARAVGDARPASR